MYDQYKFVYRIYWKQKTGKIEMFTQKIKLIYFIEVVGVYRNGPKSFFIYELSFILFYVSLVVIH